MRKIITAVAALAALAAAFAVPALTQPAAPKPTRLAPPPPARALPAPLAPAAVPSSMGQVQMTFAPVVKRVIPAVVNVYAKSVAQVQVNPLFSDPLFQRFFSGTPEMRQRVQQSLGSGVIVRD